MGHTEVLLRLLFEKAAECSKNQPVVIFFDEADQYMSSSVADSNMQALQASIKDFFTTSLKSCGAIYVFAATSWPEKINMGDWGRRFSRKWHVRLPSLEGRIALLRGLLALIGEELSSGDLQVVAEALENRSVYDIGTLIDAIVFDKNGRLLECNQWDEIAQKGETVLVPAEGMAPNSLIQPLKA